jgi:transcriptional regulator with XRE-family HTH domain
VTNNSESIAVLSLGHRVAQARLKQNLTQLALAHRAGVAYSTLRKIESTGHGAVGHYAAIWLALGQLDQLPFSAMFSPSNQPSAESLPRKRARAPKVSLAVGAAPSTPQTTPRLSEKLGLDFPYDWSNPAISDVALIGKVLAKARFMDVSKTFAHYGHARIKQVAADLGIDLHQGVLGSLMPGLQSGFERATADV